MLRQFVFVWVLYWIAVAVLPVHSIYPGTFQAFLLQLSFVCIVWFCAKTVLDMFHIRRMPAADKQNINYSASLIRIAIFLSIIGLIALAYDKMYIQKIDYSAGVATAKEQWRELGEDRAGGASSVFSAVGYLLGSCYFVAVVLAVTQGAILSARARLITFVTCFLLLMVNSLLTGGRSAVLLIAAFVAAAFSARRGIAVRGLFASALQRRFIQSLVLIAAAYTVFIFYDRAAAGDLSGAVYATNFLPFMGLEADSWYRNALGNGSPMSSIVAMLVLAGCYITHSFSTVAAIVDAPFEDKSIIFLTVGQLLYKLGIVGRPDEGWILAGRFPTVPGALWHQFGPLGFFVGSVLLGFTAGAAKVWAVRRPDHLLSLGAYSMATATLIVSPAVFAPDFTSFPFVVAAFVILAVAAKFVVLRRARSSQTHAPGGVLAAPGIVRT
jgi:oligosaccharide repeat unit polymerase